MARKSVIIISVIAILALVGAIVGVLVWYFLREPEPYVVILLEGDGIGDAQSHAALTRMRGMGDMFWWFFPTTADNPSSRPLIMWLDGVTGIPPSLLANFGMFGPYDYNLNPREDSWINEFNLLFVDAPLGTGFSTTEDPEVDYQIPTNFDDNADHLIYTLEAFYSQHREHIDSPLYIFGQGDGAPIALSFAQRLDGVDSLSRNLRGVVLANGIIDPALALTKLGFYLEELGYIDGNGRDAVENFSDEVNEYCSNSLWEEAFDLFITLGQFINENAGAIAVNLGHIVEKLTREPTQDFFGQKKQLADVTRNVATNVFMNQVVGPAIGIPSHVVYDSQRENVTRAFRSFYMASTAEKVEYILQNLDISVIIYNGNLDAVSNTPGQLEWVEQLQWSGQSAFLSSPRQTLVVNGLVQGYYRETERLAFYWINAAGQSAVLDSPDALRRVVQRITNN